MKFKALSIASAGLALSLALAPPAFAAAKAAATPLQLSATASSTLKVLGDSTLHKWLANETQLQIQGELGPASGPLWEAVQKGGLKGLTLSAQVLGLKSTESTSMDKNLDKAMEADKFPAITFVMSSYAIKEGQVAAKGTLSIHGVSKDVELKGSIAPKDKAVAVKGSFDLLMSDYGVKPPVMMLGTVRVVDKVSIAYDFALQDPAAPVVEAKAAAAVKP